MNLKTASLVTALLMAITAVLWIGWDILVEALGLTPATESRILLAFGYVNIFLPSAAGVVIGHIWWPTRGRRRYPILRYTLLGVYGAILLGLNIAGLVPPVVPIIPFLLNVPVGRLLWPQPMPNASR